MKASTSSAPGVFESTRNTLRRLHYSYVTEKSYLQWIKRFLIFHGRKSPRLLGPEAVERFLTSLAIEGNVSPATQNQALNAIVFLYREVLGQDLGEIKGVAWAKKRVHIPEFFSRSEVTNILSRFRGTRLIVASLMYGAGLRLAEVLRLRVKDLDFTRGQILIRDSKSQKDRETQKTG